LFNPETQIVGSRRTSEGYEYDVDLDGRRLTVAVPDTAFKRVTPGILGAPERRRIVASMVKKAAADA